MKYHIIAFGDCHWGVMDARKQSSEMKCILEYIAENPVDLVVICGDYFDHKLSMNSAAAVNAINFFDNLTSLAKKRKFKVRIFDGTAAHDYDQLEALRAFEDEYTSIFRKCTYEETLPNFHCIYCPDELLCNEDYFNEYHEILLDGKKYDAMFFHGTFDAQLGDLTKNLADKNNVIFEIAVFNKLCNVMVGGHWHNGDSIGNMHYTRSVNRWMFGEELPKGFIDMEYDTETDTYEINRVPNKYTDTYNTYTVITSAYTDRAMYSKLISDVDDELSSPSMHIRLMIYVDDDKELNKICIDTLTQKYGNNRRVKVATNNLKIKAKKAEKSKQLDKLKESYGFLFDNSPIARQLKNFIKATKGVDVEEDDINELIKPCLEENNIGNEIRNG